MTHHASPRCSAILAETRLEGKNFQLAPEDAGEGGDAAADHEAGHGRADQHLLAVTRELRAPVRELVDLALQVVDRVLELLAGHLDRRADLLGGAAGHQRRASSIAARVFLASSIAICGTGGEPFLKARRAIRARIPANTSRRTQ